jgi:hypothetical protein
MKENKISTKMSDENREFLSKFAANLTTQGKTKHNLFYNESLLVIVKYLKNNLDIYRDIIDRYEGDKKNE